MRKQQWHVVLAVTLIVTSLIFYLVNYLVFRDPSHMLVWILNNLGFLPIQILFVTLIVDELLKKRERKAMLEKMNMVIGTFFSEVGKDLLVALTDFDQKSEKVMEELVIEMAWTDRDFARVSEKLKKFPHEMESRAGDLGFLRSFLTGKRTFMLRLLENPVLLEHGSFTDMLWAIFHVKDELSHRESLKGLPDNDYNHLSFDIERAYRFLLCEWLGYMNHLRKEYPYLFHLALRTNPFDPNAEVVIK